MTWCDTLGASNLALSLEHNGFATSDLAVKVKEIMGALDIAFLSAYINHHGTA